MNLMLKDNDTQQPSTNRSIFFYGCLVCILKLALSKVNLGFMQVPEFAGSDFAVAVAALGGIYSLDKHISKNKKDE